MHATVQWQIRFVTNHTHPLIPTLLAPAATGLSSPTTTSKRDGKRNIGVSWFARTMKLTRFERMTLWMSALLESHALPLRHSSQNQVMSLIGFDVVVGAVCIYYRLVLPGCNNNIDSRAATHQLMARCRDLPWLCHHHIERLRDHDSRR
jgi:hypothetical protein